MWSKTTARRPPQRKKVYNDSAVTQALSPNYDPAGVWAGPCGCRKAWRGVRRDLRPSWLACQNPEISVSRRLIERRVVLCKRALNFLPMETARKQLSNTLTALSGSGVRKCIDATTEAAFKASSSTRNL